MTKRSADDRFDAQLRNVPTPEGLLERLRNSIAPTDEELDLELARVAVPELCIRDDCSPRLRYEWMMEEILPNVFLAPAGWHYDHCNPVTGGAFNELWYGLYLTNIDDDGFWNGTSASRFFT